MEQALASAAFYVALMAVLAHTEMSQYNFAIMKITLGLLGTMFVALGLVALIVLVSNTGTAGVDSLIYLAP